MQITKAEVALTIDCILSHLERLTKIRDSNFIVQDMKDNIDDELMKYTIFLNKLKGKKLPNGTTISLLEDLPF